MGNTCRLQLLLIQVVETRLAVVVVSDVVGDAAVVNVAVMASTSTIREIHCANAAAVVTDWLTD